VNEMIGRHKWVLVSLIAVGLVLRLTFLGAANSPAGAASTPGNPVGTLPDDADPGIALLGHLPGYVGPYDEHVWVVGIASEGTEDVRVYKNGRHVRTAGVADGRFLVEVALDMRANEIYVRGVDEDGKLGDKSELQTVYRRIVGEQIPPKAGATLRVYYNGWPVEFDVQPYITNGRTLVPVRKLAEIMGFEVTWHQADKRVIITGDRRITLTIGEKTATVNDYPLDLDVAPEITDSRTMVPLRFITEALGSHVQWDGVLRSVFVTRE